MRESELHSRLARRMFLTRLGAGVGMLGATAATAPTAAAQAVSTEKWQPTRHELDDWYDNIPGKHRFVFDTISPEGIGNALQFAGNFFEANKTGYGLTDADSAVIVIVRHKSTAFGYNDAMWAKYGAKLSEFANNFVDPKTKEIPSVNVYATDKGRMDGLIKRGAHIAVCQMATRAYAGMLARSSGGNADEIFNELGKNLVSNGHLVPAGILAVNRAQEHGYTIASVG
jgi:hypothetical protein